MKRLFVVYNPRSSRAADVREQVLDQLLNLKGCIIGKYEVEKSGVDQNVAKFAKILKDGDLVISAGGDATGVIATNAILKSKKDVTLVVLPYGNFNDLACTLGTKTLTDVVTWTGGAGAGDRNIFFSDHKLGRTASSVSEKKIFGQDLRQNFFPLEIFVNDKFFRYATCYVTIGMMAEAVKIYDQPRMRKILRTSNGRHIGSYTNLAGWYFKNRHQKQFLSEFKLNGTLKSQKTSDYFATNGKYMARVMRCREDYNNPHSFHSDTDKLTSFPRLAKFMLKSMFIKVPGDETKGDILEFLQPATIAVQAEGEQEIFQNVQKIEIKKSQRPLKVVKL